MKFLKRFAFTEDERLNTTKNKIYKESFYLVFALCFISVFTKFFLLDWKFKTFAAELIIVVIASFYSLIRSVQLGVYSEEAEMYDKKHKTPLATVNVIIATILGIAMALFFGTRNAILYGNGTGQRIWFFIIVFVGSVMIYGAFFVVYFIVSHSMADSISRKQSGKKQHDD